jgi:hypothetical protein
VLANARVWPNNLGNNPKIIVPGKVGLTERLFNTPGLPEWLMRLRRRSISNAYLRCMYYLNPHDRSNWLISLNLFVRAFAADPLNSPYLVRQVVSVGLSQFPVVYLTVQFLRLIIRWLGRIPLHILAVAFALVVMAASGPESIESGAATFSFVSTPLLLLLIARRLGTHK